MPTKAAPESAKILRGLSCEERMTFEVLIRAPVARPTCMDEHSLASHVYSTKSFCRNCASEFLSMDNNSLQID